MSNEITITEYEILKLKAELLDVVLEAEPLNLKLIKLNYRREGLVQKIHELIDFQRKSDEIQKKQAEKIESINIDNIDPVTGEINMQDQTKSSTKKKTAKKK